MNSIIFTHVAASARGEFALDVALDRLGAWLDTEMSALKNLLDISGYGDANENIVLLEGLHLEAFSSPTDTRRLLAEAQASLESLLECVQKISADHVVDVRAPSDLDAWQRWSGARLQDIVVTLSRALRA